jgi:hypothetical protein
MILIAIPYHKRKRYALKPLMDWLEHAEFPDCEIIMRTHNGVFGELDAVKVQREFFRELAIDLEATHLFFVGADTIPPLDVVPRLLAHKLDVVGGLYFSNLEGSGDAVAWKHSDKAKSFLDETLPEVDGMGMDCVLLSREALSSFSFLDSPTSDDDYPIYEMLRQKGFKVYLDTSLVCKHYSSKTNYSGW